MLLVYLRNPGPLLTKDSLYCVWAHACNHNIIEAESDHRVQEQLGVHSEPSSKQTEWIKADTSTQGHFTKILFSDFYLLLYFSFTPVSHSVSQHNKPKSKSKPLLAHNLPSHKDRLLCSCLECYCFSQQEWETVFVFNISFGTQIYSIM